MTDERWLPIPGHEGRYEVSDFGRVRNSQTGWLLSTPANGNGYPVVSLPCAEAKVGFRARNVHGLVALAFIGPRPEGQEVRHLDGVRTNCRLDNLLYGTQLENEADKRRHGTHEKARRTVCPLGHRLAAPNLVLGALRRGHRNCMACGRGRRTVSQAKRRGVTLDLRTEADRHYRAILDQAVGATTAA